MSIQRVLAVINQKNKASFPNQEAQRVFAKLQKNHNVRMDQMNQAASLADQYVQSLVSRGKMPAPPVDEAANIASSQVVGKVVVDQAELTATGQEFVKGKQNLQNAGISSGGSLQNNVSSSNLPINASNVQQSLYDEREEIADLIGELTAEGVIKVPIRDREGKLKTVRTLKSTTPTLIERELSRRTGPKSSDYGRPDLTAIKHDMDLGSTYDARFFNQGKALNYPASVTIGGETVPVNPVSKPVIAKTPYTQTEYVDDQLITSLKVPYVSKATAINLQDRVNNQLQYRGSMKLQIQNEFLAELKPFQAMQAELVQKADINKKKVELLNKRTDINPAQKQRISGQLAQEYQTLKNQYAYTNQEVSRITNRRDSRVAGITATTQNIIDEQRLPLTTAAGVSKGTRFHAELVDDPKGKRVKPSGGDDLLTDMADDLVDDADSLDLRGATPDPAAYKMETVQLRPERPMIDTDKKRGGGRNLAQYTGGGSVDEKVSSISTGGLIQETPQRLRRTQGRYRDYDTGTDELNPGGGAPQGPFRNDGDLTENVVDLYGIRRSSDPEDIERVKPSQLVGEMRGAQNQKVSKKAQEIIKRSLKISEDRRKARIEGAAPVNYDSYLNKKPLGSYVPAEEKPVKRGKAGSLLGEFLSKNYYSVNKFPSI
jgi:hypothetical protein